jgi:hypothetical protein
MIGTENIQRSWSESKDFRSKTMFLSLMIATLTAIPTLAKNKTAVRIISETDTTSTYVVATPGSQSANCTGGTSSVNCTGMTLPAIARNMDVRGHVLYLQLPDKRVVVASCDAKPNWTDWHQGMYRDCRLPVVDSVEAEISGDRVKLIWSVSLDGKKTQNETYKILGVLLPK